MPDVTPSRAESDGEPAALADLLVAASRGEPDAWRELVELYSRRVFALARSRCRSPELAEEITQSVFVTIATKLSQSEYTEKGRFESWLFRVAMNRIRDEARRIKRHAVPTEPETMAAMADRVKGGATAEKRISEEGEQELARLRMCLDQLTDADREIVELRHHGQMSFQQLAEMLSEPVGTLLARHHRALKKLKEMMTLAEQDEHRCKAEIAKVRGTGIRIGSEQTS